MLAQSQNAAPSNPIRIVIADDHPWIIDSVCLALRKRKDMKVVGTVANGQALVDCVEQEQPDVAIVDIQMPVKDGIAATKEIRERFPHIRIIAFSGFADETYITEMMIEAGASGYLLKESPKQEIFKAIEKVSKDEIYCSEEIYKKFLALSQRTTTNPLKPFAKPSFTEKELSVMIENANELSSKEIAQKLNTSMGAVDSTKQRLFEKTGTRGNVGLALYAVRHNIVRLWSTVTLPYLVISFL